MEHENYIRYSITQMLKIVLCVSWQAIYILSICGRNLERDGEVPSLWVYSGVPLTSNDTSVFWGIPIVLFAIVLLFHGIYLFSYIYWKCMKSL